MKWGSHPKKKKKNHNEIEASQSVNMQDHIFLWAWWRVRQKWLIKQIQTFSFIMSRLVIFFTKKKKSFTQYSTVFSGLLRFEPWYWGRFECVTPNMCDVLLLWWEPNAVIMWWNSKIFRNQRWNINDGVITHRGDVWKAVKIRVRRVQP